MADKTDPEADAANRREIDDILTFLSLAERKDWNVPDFLFFDQAILGWGSILGEYCKQYKMTHRFVDECLDRVANVRGAMVCAGEKGIGARYSLVGGRELSLSERPRVARLLNAQLPIPLDPMRDRIVDARAVSVFPDGTARGLYRLHYYHARGHWYPSRQDNDHEAVSLGIVALCSHLAKTTWRASVRFHESMPSVALYTDAVGIRDFFRFREIPAGERRRSSLLHWVTRHWRRDRADDESEVFVREHLRGRRRFHWNGMIVDIDVPEAEEARVVGAVEHRGRLARAKLARRRRALDGLI